MQAYSSTLLQFIFKFQLVYFPYFYDDKVQKKCTNLVHSCNQMVHSYFARYSPNRKILAKNARYLPFLSDICLYLPKSHNWGGRGRWFKSSHSDHKSTVILIELRWAFSIPENRLESGFSAVRAHKRTPLQAILRRGFVRFMGIVALCSAVIVKLPSNR